MFIFLIFKLVSLKQYKAAITVKIKQSLSEHQQCQEEKNV